MSNDPRINPAAIDLDTVLAQLTPSQIAGLLELDRAKKAEARKAEFARAEAKKARAARLSKFAADAGRAILGARDALALHVSRNVDDTWHVSDRASASAEIVVGGITYNVILTVDGPSAPIITPSGAIFKRKAGDGARDAARDAAASMRARALQARLDAAAQAEAEAEAPKPSGK